jgi:myosin heavy subunit
LAIYDKRYVRVYKGKRIGLAPPHIFAIAESAFNAMVEHKHNQSVLVRYIGVTLRVLVDSLCCSID